MTRQTCELFTRAVMPTGTITLGNGSGRAAILPSKQVLTFVWSITAQRALILSTRTPAMLSSTWLRETERFSGYSDFPEF